MILKSWVLDIEFFFLLVEGLGMCISSFDFVVDFFDVVRERGYYIIWLFFFFDGDE